MVLFHGPGFFGVEEDHPAFFFWNGKRSVWGGWQWGGSSGVVLEMGGEGGAQNVDRR